MERPIRRMLEKASVRLSLHMPAAQGRAPFGPVDPYRLDTTELSVTDDLYRPRAAILRAEALAARSAGAAHTLLLHGGATAGIHTMLLYALNRGDTVILPRNTHVSALHLCALFGLEPVFAEPSYTASGRPYTEVAAYERAMEAHPQAKAVLVLRPDFYGLLPDLRALSKAAHLRGMRVLCDEAHGATFNWRKDVENAGALGADLFVQSAHKTLPALTAGAWLHAMEGVDADRLRRLLRMVQTSSPSFVNLLSLDDARAWMDAYGEKACKRQLAQLNAFRRKAAALGYESGQDDAPPGLAYDPLRLVLRGPQGGYALEEALGERGMDVEMADEHCVVIILSLLDGGKRLKALYRALAAIARENPPQGRAAPRPAASKAVDLAPRPAASKAQKYALKAMQPAPKAINPAPETANPASLPPKALPERAAPLAQAAFAPTQPVPLEACAHWISGAHVGLYPPGVALLTAGERISRDMAAFLQNAPQERLFGLTQAGQLPCLCEDISHPME